MESQYAHRPPHSVASTTSTTPGGLDSTNSPFPHLSADSHENDGTELGNATHLEDDIDVDAIEPDLGEEGEEWQMMREDDELINSHPLTVQFRADQAMGLKDMGVDVPNLMASEIFKRPWSGKHKKEEEMPKAHLAIFEGYIKHLDETEWMYPTPDCFKPYQADPSASMYNSLDLPIYSQQNRTAWYETALNLQDGSGILEHASVSAAQLAVPVASEADDADRSTWMGDAEAELELSFTERGGGPSHAQLAREVSRLGMI